MRNRGWEREGEKERATECSLSNDAAGACICDVNSAVAASPGRLGATPPRTLSDYFTVNSLRASACSGSVLRASHFSAALLGEVRFHARLL